MSHEHEIKNPDQPHQVDTGSQALAEALRGSFQIVRFLLAVLVVVFLVSGMSTAVQNALNNALLTTAARFSVDEILTSDKTRFQDSVTRRVVELARAQELGISVDQCTVQSRAPRQLREAFARVNIASQNRGK